MKCQDCQYEMDEEETRCQYCLGAVKVTQENKLLKQLLQEMKTNEWFNYENHKDSYTLWKSVVNRIEEMIEGENNE